MVQTSIDLALECLESLKKSREMYCTEKVSVELRFLRTFFKYAAKWSNCNVYWRSDANEDVSLNFLLDNIDAAVNETAQDLQLLCEQTNRTLFYMEFIVSKLEERLGGFKPEIREAQIALLKNLWQSDSPILSDELLLELINSVVHNLRDLLFSNDILPVKEHVKALEKWLRFLRNFVRFTSKCCMEHDQLEDLLIHAEAVATDTANLCFMCWFSKMPTSMEEKYFELLKKIKPVNPDIRELYIRVLKASRSPGLTGTPMMDELLVGELIDFLHENILELLECKSSFMVPVKDQMTTLSEELRFLKTFLMDQRKLYAELPEKLNGVLYQVGEMTSEAAILIFSFYADEMQEDETKEMSLALIDLQGKINLITSEIKRNCLKLLAQDIPRTDDLGFIDLLLANLKELVNHTTDLAASAKHQIQRMNKDIVFLRSFLGEISEQCNESEELNSLWACIMDMAYQTKGTTDSLKEGDCPGLCSMLCDCLVEEIKLIKAEVIKIYYGKRYDQASNPTIDEVVVGLSDEAETIINLLTRGSTELDVVSIIGMPGLGKTTLAKKVFNDDSIRYHFHVRAWCVVSQAYRRREVLLDILSDVAEHTDQIYEMSVEDLEERLYKLLKRKRYLIVMDDMWNIGAWDDVNRSFPNDSNGSRILLTSRLHGVALQVKRISDPHPLRLFSDSESWDLLQKKIFDKESFPEELEEVGKKIAKNCKGLPLAVVVIAGLLSRIDKKQDCWEQIAESLSSQIAAGDPKLCMEVLELSYKHLPNHLKTCFLYFGIFREDQEIPVWKLKWLWIAEGFVKKSGLKTSEDLAEDYLMDLIGRSLVMVAKRRSNGGVKACRVHDLLHNLCVTKAKQENLLQRIHDHDKLLDSPTAYKRGRLCIYCKWRYFTKSNPSGPRVQSLLLFATGESYREVPRDVTFIPYKFKRLQVLDLGSINAGDLFPDGIQWLVQLRYLAVRGRMTSVPSSIANLWNLETFLVKGLRGKIVLPSTIWSMVKLRHLHINDSTSFSLHNNNAEKSSQLDNLLTISTLCLSYGKEAEIILGRLLNIRKLKCLFLEVWDSSKNCYQFPVLDFLCQLESLNVFSGGKVQFPCKLNFPLNLKKLTLSKFCMPWSEISRIARLPHLEVLKLLFRAFEGEQWEMTEEEFPKLRYLKLDNLNITHWSASSTDHFPLLQQLVLQRCNQLKEIPSCLGNIPTLEVIEVLWCNSSTAGIVREIQEEQIDMGNEALKVFIYPVELDKRSS